MRVDVESVMNSIVSLLLILETEKQEALIESLCEKLVKFREGERPTLRMQLYVHTCPFICSLIFYSFIPHPSLLTHSLSFHFILSLTRLFIHSLPPLTRLFIIPLIHPLLFLFLCFALTHSFIVFALV